MATADTILRLGNMEGNAEPTINCYPETTTISTIAIESGKTRAVIAVLQSGHFINLRILEMAPKLGSIARNASDSEEMLKQHEQVMEKLKGKQTPVEEMLLQADKVGPTKNPQVYKAMAASLGTAWKDVNATLDFRRQILKKAFEFHTNRSNCIDYFTQLNQDKKLVLVTYRYAVEDGRRLIDKLKRIVKDEPEEASYSIGLVYIWLDELQAARQGWAKGLKLIASKDRQNLIAKEYERIIQDIEAKFQAGEDPQEIRNSLLHLSSCVDKSETTESQKLHLQRLIFNLVERVTIVMELEQEIKTFLETTTILAQPNFKHVYEEKLKLMGTFGLHNADELKTRLEKRLEARHNFETILENPFDYEDEAIEKLLNLDPGLDIASALAQIRAAKTGSLKSLFEYFEDEMKDVEVRYTSLGSSAAKESEILILKEKIKNMEDVLQSFEKDEELPKRATLSAKCQHFRELLNRAEAVAKFLSANNVLDAPGFENSYAAMLCSDLCCRAEVPNPLRETVATRYEIQKKFDAMVENPTAFSEGHIETICNWDPTLDTREAHNKLLRLRQKARDSGLNEGNEPVKMEVQLKERENENLNELEEQILVEESYGLHSGPPQTRLEEQINAENEKQQKLEEMRSEEEFRRQQADAEKIRQQVEAEVRRQQAKAEQLRLQTEAELKRQQDEAERLRQEAEADRLRQQAELRRQQAKLEHQQFEAERIRQQAEAELMRQQLQAQLKLQQAEEQLRRQQAEIEQNRQQAEEELRRQQAEIEEKRRQAEMELEQRRAEAEFHQHQLEQQLQQQLALEEAQRQFIEEELRRQKQELAQQRKFLELQRQKEDDERQRQLEAHERQLEADRQRQLDALQKQKADAERLRQELELERQKVEQERLRQLEEVSRQKAAEEERMRQLEEDQRRISDERQRQLEELERQKAEAEEKRHLEDLERQRLREAELLRQLEIDVENERLRQLRQANLDRERQNKVLEQQLELELEQKRHELEQLDFERQKALDFERQKIEVEKQRQTELENQRKTEEQKQQALEEQRRQALELQRQREIQIQLELEAQQRFDAEEKRKAAEREALEAQKLREEHLEHLFKTLDFPLPENLDTARSDLRDFQKFEAIVEEMDNPPLELIEKMYEKKNKILQCLQFYELIQKPDRILYIREIMELERNVFRNIAK